MPKLETWLDSKLGRQTRAVTSLNVCKNSVFELSLITNVQFKLEKAQTNSMKYMNISIKTWKSLKFGEKYCTYSTQLEFSSLNLNSTKLKISNLNPKLELNLTRNFEFKTRNYLIGMRSISPTNLPSMKMCTDRMCLCFKARNYNNNKKYNAK